MKHKWIFFLLFIALLPLLSLRDYTVGNELRYLSIADEAIRNGTFFAFTNHGAFYADKPPLYFWIIMTWYKLPEGPQEYSGCLSPLLFSSSAMT